MERLQELFSRKIAGVPVGLLAALIAAGLLVLALRSKGASTSADTSTEDTGNYDEPAGDAASNDLENPVFSASPTTPTVVATAQTDTNDLWAGRARSWLAANGSNPVAASNLVSKYLNEDPLTAAEQTQLNSLILALGYPPEPPATINDVVNDLGDNPGSDDTSTDMPTEVATPVVTAPSQTQNPSKQGVPPCKHTVQNAKDNGPGELAVLYYGSNASSKVVRLEAANWELGKGPWSPGTVVKIPDDIPAQYFTATKTVKGAEEIGAKNGVDKRYIFAINPGVSFPVPVGTKVRVR